MSYLLYDNGASIKFVSENGEFLLMKLAIANISIVRGDVIKISKETCMGSIFFRHQSVSSPETASAIDLIVLINAWFIPGPQFPSSD